jgi:hypothetical protein
VLTRHAGTLALVATAMIGKHRRPSYPPAPPAEWSLAERERAVLAVLADVAAIQLEALPQQSLVRRLVEPLLHELDCWASDPRYAGRALGYGGVDRRNRPRPGSLEDQHAHDLLRLRQEGRTQREVAAELGCSQALVCRVERKLNGAAE